MTRSDLFPMPDFFDRYINLVDDIDLMDALAQTARFENLLSLETLEALGDRVYAPGKWISKDILQHIIDNERIMSYRALRFARNDQTPLPGYDEDPFAQFAHASRRTLPDLYDEYALVRQSTLALFRNFDEEMLLRSGIASNREISVLALGFVLVGHPIHHVNIIRERYLPLLT